MDRTRHQYYYRQDICYHVAYLYEKCDREGEELKPGTWRLIGGPDKSYCYVIIRCPDCKETTQLAFFENEYRYQQGHYISDGGTIRPSVGCSCGFHPDSSGLEEWDSKAIELKKEEVDG